MDNIAIYKCEPKNTELSLFSTIFPNTILEQKYTWVFIYLSCTVPAFTDKINDINLSLLGNNQPTW